MLSFYFMGLILGQYYQDVYKKEFKKFNYEY